jgi:putative membrane protein
MLPPVLQKNDKKASVYIIVFSLIVFVAITALSKIKLEVNLPFDKHLFAQLNAFINSMVSGLLVAGLISVKSKRFQLHKKIMITAMILSVLFLLSYTCHHLFTGETRFGDTNHDGILSEDEKLAAGTLRYVYYFIISTHITLAGIIMPFVLFTAYRALIAEFPQHKKLAKITWPIWLYVAVTGVLVYFMISPFYQ